MYSSPSPSGPASRTARLPAPWEQDLPSQGREPAPGTDRRLEPRLPRRASMHPVPSPKTQRSQHRDPRHRGYARLPGWRTAKTPPPARRLPKRARSGRGKRWGQGGAFMAAALPGGADRMPGGGADGLRARRWRQQQEAGTERSLRCPRSARGCRPAGDMAERGLLSAPGPGRRQRAAGLPREGEPRPPVLLAGAAHSASGSEDVAACWRGALVAAPHHFPVVVFLKKSNTCKMLLIFFF